MMMEAEMIAFAAITGVCREPRWILKVEKSGNKVHLVTTWPKKLSYRIGSSNVGGCWSGALWSATIMRTSRYSCKGR